MYSDLGSFKGQLVSMAEVYRLCFHLALEIKAEYGHPDVIVAIGRGGFVPARFICDFLNVSALTSIKVHHYNHFVKQNTVTIPFPLSGEVNDQKVLVVDDVNDTGLSLSAAVAHIREHHPLEIKTAVIHEKENDTFKVDHCAHYIKQWRWIFYPWARMEDLEALMSKMDPTPSTPEKAKALIRDRYGMDVPLAELVMVFQLQNQLLHKA